MLRWYEQVVTRHSRDSSVLADALDAPCSSTDIVPMSIIGGIGCCDFDQNPFCVPALLLGNDLRFNPVPRLYHADILSLLHILSHNIFCMLHLWPSSDIFARLCQSSQVDIVCVGGQDCECWGRWLETGNRIEVELQEGVTALKILWNEHM